MKFSSTYNQTAQQQHPIQMMSSSVPLKGIICDMDGTLIELNVIDEVVRQIYQIADEEDPIGDDLDREERDDVDVIISKLSPEGKRKAKMAIWSLLQQHIDNMIIQQGGPELIAFLAQNGVKRAVLTRNYERNVSVMQEMYTAAVNEATFDWVIGRDTPYDGIDKPSKEIPKADRIRQICNTWGCDTSEVIMLGDSILDDIVEGNRAGCGGTVLLQPKGYKLNDFYGTTIGNSVERKPTLCVETLSEVRQILEAQMDSKL